MLREKCGFPVLELGVPQCSTCMGFWQNAYWHERLEETGCTSVSQKQPKCHQMRDVKRYKGPSLLTQKG
jgi:hypothetical protein